MTPQRKAARSPHPTISDVALALASRSQPPQSKVSLTRNAKGDVQIEVEVGATVPTVAAEQARAVFDTLCATYPRAVFDTLCATYPLAENGGPE